MHSNHPRHASAAYMHASALNQTLTCCIAFVQFPELFEGPALRLVHHATQQLDDLVSSLSQHFRDTFTPGEEALALRGGFPASCIVVQEVPEGLPALQPGTAQGYMGCWVGDGSRQLRFADAAPVMAARSSSRRQRQECSVHSSCSLGQEKAVVLEVAGEISQRVEATVETTA